MYSSQPGAEFTAPTYDSYDWASEDLTPADLREEPEFARYFDRWIKFSPRKPYNVKRGYDGGFIQAKTSKGNPAALYGDWLISCVERHLSNYRWAEQRVEKEKAQAIADLVAQGQDEELAAGWVSHQTWAGYYPVVDRLYWLGLWPSRKITDHSIDFDAKEYLLAHYRHRGVVEPVVCPDLDHFQKLKRIYDHFPNRVWCISSLTLGVHAWAKHDLWERQAVHGRVKEHLTRLGLGSVEVHPMQGRCLRRPFGRDYLTVTPEGELTAWQDQVAYYEDDGRTAPFGRIVEAMIRRVERSVSSYYRADETLKDWRALVPLRPRLDAVRSWRDSGFKERVLVPTGRSPTAAGAEPTGPERGRPTLSGADRSEPELSATEDRPTCGGEAWEPLNAGSSLRRSDPSVPALRDGKWPLRVEAMARTGLVADDTVGEVVFEMAKWLYWVELYDMPEAERRGRVQTLLERYVLAKHNGHVTRILNHQAELVLSQVKSAVGSASRVERPESLELFAELRRRRERGVYRRPIAIAPILEGAIPEIAHPPPSSSSPSTTLLFSIKDSPLPDELEVVLRRIADDHKMRRRCGEYPLVRFARRFLHVLWDNRGAARLDIKALKELSGVNSPKVQNDYKRLLRDAGLLDDWENDYLKASSMILDAPLDPPPACRMSERYRVGVAPILYRLTESAEEAFQREPWVARHVERD